jgi:hypothetical protein
MLRGAKPSLLLIALFASCSTQGPAPADNRVVAFRQSTFVIDQLDTPTMPPYAVGSIPSRDSLASSDQSVVDIDSSGGLIGRRNGEAIVTARGDAKLRVIVRAVRALAVEPAQLSMPLGSRRQLQLVADGHPLPPETVRWQTTNPNIAAAFGSEVHAGTAVGAATLTATAGAAQATVEVVVTQPSLGGFAVQPSRVELKVGAVQRLSVDAGAPIGITWTSSDPSVLQPMRDGLFYARAIGRSHACASAGDQKSCAQVRVTR